MDKIKTYPTTAVNVGGGKTICQHCASEVVAKFSGGYHNNDCEEWFECSCETAKKLSDLREIYNKGDNARREIERVNKITAPTIVQHHLKNSINNSISNYKQLYKVNDADVKEVLQEIIDKK